MKYLNAEIILVLTTVYIALDMYAPSPLLYILGFGPRLYHEN